MDGPDLRSLGGGLVRAENEQLGVVLKVLLVLLRSLLRPGIRRMRLHRLDDQIDRPIHAQSFRKVNSIQMRVTATCHHNSRR